MPLSRLVRPAIAVGLLLLMAACVAPPVVVAPGQGTYGQECSAGFYQCVLPAPGQVGAPCACPGIGAASYGTIR